MMSSAVRGTGLMARLPAWAEPLVEASHKVGENAGASLRLAEEFGLMLPQPGDGDTAARWAVLAAVSRESLTAGRVLEAHSDALAILAEAGEPAPAGTWGVFAAEAAPHRLEARQGGGGIALHGVKPWCSLAEQLDAALVTAHVGSERQLFRVPLQHPSVTFEPADGWVARGLRTVTSVAIHLDGTPALAVGPTGWYLVRPGFAWGGMGVAACWHGGACGLQATLVAASTRRSGELSGLHVGLVDAALHASESVLAGAAALIDNGEAKGAAGAELALRVRAVVADAAERTLRQVGHALGPAPLAFDEDHARRVADLELYLRQHHGERDLARLGEATLERGRQDPER
jgi:hypothetical protein